MKELVAEFIDHFTAAGKGSPGRAKVSEEDKSEPEQHHGRIKREGYSGFMGADGCAQVIFTMVPSPMIMGIKVKCNVL